MKFANQELRSKLAAEYVLGTLSPRARRRFQAKLREIPQLRHAVTDWEKWLTPMADAIPGVEPPARVWQAIQARTFGRQTPRHGWFSNLAFWRFSSAASGLVALGLLIALVLPRLEAPSEIPGARMVVVMNDVQTSKPAMTAAWEPGVPGKPGARMIRIRVIGHAEMAPGTSWELWMLPGPNQKPVSLGLISTHETQTVPVPAALADRLDNAAGLAMSVEPHDGSPTGAPTGPILYAGDCIKT